MLRLKNTDKVYPGIIKKIFMVRFLDKGIFKDRLTSVFYTYPINPISSSIK